MELFSLTPNTYTHKIKNMFFLFPLSFLWTLVSLVFPPLFLFEKLLQHNTFLIYPPHFILPVCPIHSAFSCVFTNNFVSFLLLFLFFCQFSSFSFVKKPDGFDPEKFVAQQMIYITHRKNHNNHILTCVYSQTHVSSSHIPYIDTCLFTFTCLASI